MPIRLFDDRDREVLLFRPPQRIVSLVPSDTLSVFALGAGERLVGRTRYCVEPPELAAKVPEVGGTKDVDVEAVARLAPELVIANQEENTQPALEALIKRGLTVFICFPLTVAQGLNHLARLARMLGLEGDDRVKELLRKGLREVAAAEAALKEQKPLRAFVPIWREPLMTIAGDTFISDALRLAGAENVFADRRRRYPLAADHGKAKALPDAEIGARDTRYPRITEAEVAGRAPEIVLLPDEPHEFTEADAQPLRELLPRSKVKLCDGRDLMWYGARSTLAVPRLRALIDSLR